MKLEKLGTEELLELERRVQAERKQRQNAEHATFIEETRERAEALGLPLAELAEKLVGRKRGPVAPKYRNPADKSQQWTGRGRKPKWVEAALSAGKKLSDLEI